LVLPFRYFWIEGGYRPFGEIELLSWPILGENFPDSKVEY